MPYPVANKLVISSTVLLVPMAVVAALLRLMPDAVYDRLASRAGRKPRGLPL